MMNRHVYPAGTVLNFTDGEYSDFGNRGLLVTVKECDLPALIRQFENVRDRKPWENDKEDFEPTLFPTWLVAQQYAMPVDYTEVHLGAYSQYDDDLKVGN